ncbi:glycosyltransferase [Lactiplantibacillus pentosus]|uniref:glycosyltransferase n=1 Tax=Lactiplantibacillus pentosus TaxID=1589 RepID=UPI0026FBB4AF|nr:glycosyltransferase [Lactiplantibacillus pentosus]MDO7806026.1 glycosyltransferase [Lactiplantibacillus pentosus]
MKLLFIDAFVGFGSVGRIVQELYDTAENRGFDCCIAYGRGSAPEGYKTYKIGSKWNVIEAGLESRVLDNHGFASRNATKRLIDFIEAYNPDVINLHSIHGYYLNIQILFDYLSKTKRKVVWTLHDCWPISSHSGFVQLNDAGEIPQFESKYDSTQYPKNLWWHRHSKNYFKKEAVFTQLKAQNLTIVTPSKWLKDLIHISYLSKYECRVINNGIDLSLFAPTSKTVFKEKYGIPKSKKILLFIANYWEDRKGLKYVQQLAKKITDGYQIVVVGDLMKQKLPENIIHIKQTQNREELVELYGEADYFINPTLADNFPTVNIEAQACGLPVLTFDTGGSAEMITEETGVKITDKSAQGIINALQVAENKHFSAEKCIENSKNFEKNAQYSKYIDMYEQM